MVAKIEKEQRDAMLADADPAGLVAAATGQAFDIDEFVAELASRPGASEETPEADVGVPAPEPEPEPEPELELGAEDEPEPEPEPEGGRHVREPEWIAQLPESARAEARKLHQTTEGQRRALKRRAEQVRQADFERRQAIEIAVQLKKMQQGAPGRAGESPETPDPAEEFLETTIGDDGVPRVPAAKLRELVAAEARKLVEGRSAEQQRAAQVGQYATELLADAGISEATQQRMVEAVSYVQRALASTVQKAGRMPRNPMEERAILREAGIEAEVARRFGGLRLTDVYDVYESARDPYARGDRLVEITERYQEAWKTGGKRAGSAREPARIPEHPGSMARKGSAAPARVAQGERASDDIANLTMDDAIASVKDPKVVANLFERWNEEMRRGGGMR